MYTDLVSKSPVFSSLVLFASPECVYWNIWGNKWVKSLNLSGRRILFYLYSYELNRSFITYTNEIKILMNKQVNQVADILLLFYNKRVINSIISLYKNNFVYLVSNRHKHNSQSAYYCVSVKRNKFA